jgi:hypothetical protein
LYNKILVVVHVCYAVRHQWSPCEMKNGENMKM